MCSNPGVNRSLRVPALALLAACASSPSAPASTTPGAATAPTATTTAAAPQAPSDGQEPRTEMRLARPDHVGRRWRVRGRRHQVDRIYVLAQPELAEVEESRSEGDAIGSTVAHLAALGVSTQAFEVQRATETTAQGTREVVPAGVQVVIPPAPTMPAERADGVAFTEEDSDMVRDLFEGGMTTRDDDAFGVRRPVGVGARWEIDPEVVAAQFALLGIAIRRDGMQGHGTVVAHHAHPIPAREVHIELVSNNFWVDGLPAENEAVIDSMKFTMNFMVMVPDDPNAQPRAEGTHFTSEIHMRARRPDGSFEEPIGAQTVVRIQREFEPLPDVAPAP